MGTLGRVGKERVKTREVMKERLGEKHVATEVEEESGKARRG